MVDPYNSIIFIHLGLTGCKLGSCFWELLRYEHQIRADGKFERVLEAAATQGHKGPLAVVNTKIDTFFGECKFGRYRPRAIFADLESGVIEEIQNGPCNRFYHPDQFVSGKEGASGNFARGYFTRGREFVGVLMDRIDRIVEASGLIQGFIVMRSLGGGTGSGLGSLLLQLLQEKYPKSVRVTIDILPSLALPGISAEPYNVVLASHSSIETSDLTFLMENDATLRMCQEYQGIEKPDFQTVNRLLSEILSTLTSSLHMEGTVNRSLAELRSNLIPYQRLHYPLISYAPLLPAHTNASVISATSTVRQMLDINHQVVRCDPLRQSCMAISMIFRGDVTLENMHQVEKLLGNISNARPHFKLADWVPQKYSLGFSPYAPVSIDEAEFISTNIAGSGVINTPAIASPWAQYLTKATSMHASKYYIHWYENEGMLESELLDAAENFQFLLDEYKEVARGVNVSRPPSRMQTTCALFPFAPSPSRASFRS